MLLRSILFMPGNREKILKKIGTVEADAVFLDLEDAVPFSEKENARKIIYSTLEQLEGYNVKLYVRVNGLDTNLIEEDIESVMHPKLDGFVIPEVEKGQDILEIDNMINHISKRKCIDGTKFKLHVACETALGVLNAYDIAKSSDRIEGIGLGAEDFTRDIDAIRTIEGWELFYARSQVLLAAKAAKIFATDTVFSDVFNLEGLREDAQRSRMMGYDGKIVIHPGQVKVVNEVYTPTKEEIAYAQRVNEAYTLAQENKQGAILLDGKMIDQAVVERARKLLNNVKEIGL